MDTTSVTSPVKSQWLDTGALKKFAQEARRLLRDQVSTKLIQVLAENSAARREAPKAVRELETEIARTSRDQIIERVAYTWFNRLTALRFMDVNGYTGVRVVTPADGQTRPEILSEAMAGVLSEELPEAVATQVRALLDNRAPSSDPQGEAYRLLLVAACNHWHAAMPFMFEKIADYTELLMPADLLSQGSILTRLRTAMTEGACHDVEVIGWLYQFYISEKKDEVFAGLKKNVKIAAENIPAATQLFTPHWIVRYLVENSLGRLWMLNRPNSRLKNRMDYHITPEDPETDFLRISSPEEIKVCDPACGSGHMLTYAFDLLHAIYEEEGYDAAEIPSLILANNLYGIEIDERAGALAAFALMMKAASRRKRVLRQAGKDGVQPNICVLENVSFTDGELANYTKEVGRDLFSTDLLETLGQFAEVKNVGSLIVPKLKHVDEMRRVVAAKDFDSDMLYGDTHRRVQIVLRMSDYLSPKYHVVVANPPYMGGKGMNPRLQEFAKAYYPDSKADLFAMFIERSLAMSLKCGMMAMINMQSWMFLSSFEKLRGNLLSKGTILGMAHLGERAFDTIGGAVVSTTAFIVQHSRHSSLKGQYLRLIDGANEAAKSSMLLEAVRDPECDYLFHSAADDFEKVQGNPIAYWLTENTLNIFCDFSQLADYAHPRQGMATTNNDLFLRQWFEVAKSKTGLDLSPEEGKKTDLKWFPINKGGEFRRWYGNNFFVVNYENQGKTICDYIDNTPNVRVKSNGRVINRDRYFHEGLTWSTISSGDFALRFSPQGFLFETKGAMIFFEDPTLTKSVLGILNTKITGHLLKATSPTLDFHEGPIGRLPILISSRTVNPLARERAERAVELSKTDWDARETSWDFTTLPLLAPEYRAETLEVTYARLRSNWRRATEEMQRLEVENNRTLIDAYGLHDELSPEVPLEDITLTCNPIYRYGDQKTEAELETLLRADTVAEFVSYAVGCMFGRYSLDAPGLILANRGERLQDYLAKVPSPTFEPSADNVIPVLDGDWFADDIAGRFRKFLRMTYGDARFQENLSFVEEALGKDIRKYLIRDFFNDHVKRYKKRPIYWLFSSPKGTFNALIYMHRYRTDTVSVILNDYLREFRSKLESYRRAQEVVSISSEASPAQKTKALKELEATAKQIDEIDVWERDVLFPLATQKIDIDLDDGVKANYPKFGSALKPIRGLNDSDD